MHLQARLVDLRGDWEDHHALGGDHRLYIQPVCTEAEVGLIGNRQGDQRGFEEGSRLVQSVRTRLESGGFSVTVCPAAREVEGRVYLVVSHPEARGDALSELAERVLEQV